MYDVAGCKDRKRQVCTGRVTSLSCAVPYDLPVVGYGNNIVNTLRIWDAEAINTFNLDSFDKGDYQKAVEQENLARTICEVLYPNDNHMAGKELRLKQQYFFVSASCSESNCKIYRNTMTTFVSFHEKVYIPVK